MYCIGISSWLYLPYLTATATTFNSAYLCYNTPKPKPIPTLPYLNPPAPHLPIKKPLPKTPTPSTNSQIFLHVIEVPYIPNEGFSYPLCLSETLESTLVIPNNTILPLPLAIVVEFQEHTSPREPSPFLPFPPL